MWTDLFANADTAWGLKGSWHKGCQRFSWGMCSAHCPAGSCSYCSLCPSRNALTKRSRPLFRSSNSNRNTNSVSPSAHLLLPSSPTTTRPRRSMSTDSYGVEPPRELTAGQKKAAEDKKGSRHADVIDTWDPTGMGSASKYISFRREVVSLTIVIVWHQSVRSICSPFVLTVSVPDRMMLRLPLATRIFRQAKLPCQRSTAHRSSRHLAQDLALYRSRRLRPRHRKTQTRRGTLRGVLMLLLARLHHRAIAEPAAAA